MDKNVLQFVQLNIDAYQAGPRDAEAQAVFADYAVRTMQTLVVEIERLQAENTKLDELLDLWASGEMEKNQ